VIDEEGNFQGMALGITTSRVRATTPLDDSNALFRNFADLPGGSPIRDEHGRACLDFANQHGLLGLEFEPFKTPRGVPVQAERVRAWVAEIDAMKRAVLLWESIEQKDEESLRSRLGGRWQPGGAKLGRDTVSFGGYKYDVAERIGPSDVLARARLILSELLAKKLRDHAAPELVPDERARELSLRIVPQNLLGAMWVQFARTTEGSRDIRRCATCGTWMFISPDTFRTNRRYCSDTCRVKTHKQRKRRARDLRASGAALREIAAEFGTDMATVKRWVAGVKRGHR
jgi:hypothetical protein